MNRALALHLIVVAALAAGIFLLPVYHATNLARIMVLAVFAMGYNLAFGYTGLLSLGHAMFFAAGLYGAGLTVHYLGFDPFRGIPHKEGIGVQREHHVQGTTRVLLPCYL